LNKTQVYVITAALQLGVVATVVACDNSWLKVKVKVEFLYSATHMVDQEQRALQSQKWQLIGKSQWCCGANAAIHCPR